MYQQSSGWKMSFEGNCSNACGKNISTNYARAKTIIGA